MSEPLVSGPLLVALFLAWVVGFFAAIGIVAAFEAIRAAYIARRNERQLKAEQQMQCGFRVAQRLGWLPDDTQ